MRLHAISGNTQRLDGGAMYGNAPRALWEKWSPPDAQNRISLACRALLLETEDERGAPKRVLFEAGIGAFFEPKLKDRFGVVEPTHVLLDGLAALGLDDGSIDAVVLSHLHFDHAGGLLSAWEAGAPPRLLFPRARFYVGATHWARGQQPHARDRASFLPELHALLVASGRLQLVGDDGREGARDLEPLGVRFRFSHGHTPGLMHAELTTPANGGAPLVFAADLVPGLPWTHVPITMGYDRYPELIVDEKRALLDELVTRGGALFYTHDPDVACARVVRDDKGRFAGVPVEVGALAEG